MPSLVHKLVFANFCYGKLFTGSDKAEHKGYCCQYPGNGVNCCYHSDAAELIHKTTEKNDPAYTKSYNNEGAVL